MWAEQAIFTSVIGNGQTGYRVVSRSPGVVESEAASLAAWSPAHGALVIDDRNRVSVNYHPLTGGRVALSRSCAGAAECSGRGGAQIYTHALILEPDQVARAGSPLAIYRDAQALGYLRYRPQPLSMLEPVKLGTVFRRRDQGPAPIEAVGLPSPEDVARELNRGASIQLRHLGCRLALIGWLFGRIPEDLAKSASFSTSLRPSAVRPFRILLTS